MNEQLQIGLFNGIGAHLFFLLQAACGVRMPKAAGASRAGGWDHPHPA
jgi:hypothetical protein